LHFYYFLLNAGFVDDLCANSYKVKDTNNEIIVINKLTIESR
jgi:hypothetical protein